MWILLGGIAALGILIATNTRRSGDREPQPSREHPTPTFSIWRVAVSLAKEAAPHRYAIVESHRDQPQALIRFSANDEGAAWNEWRKMVMSPDEPRFPNTNLYLIDKTQDDYLKVKAAS